MTENSKEVEILKKKEQDYKETISKMSKLLEEKDLVISQLQQKPKPSLKLLNSSSR